MIDARLTAAVGVGADLVADHRAGAGADDGPGGVAADGVADQAAAYGAQNGAGVGGVVVGAVAVGRIVTRPVITIGGGRVAIVVVAGLGEVGRGQQRKYR